MIKKLNNSDTDVAHQILSVFHTSYKIEAELLKAKNFPPLSRTLEEYMDTETEFFGYFQGDEIAGIVEVLIDPVQTHIQSLVVHPYYFRQGIGRKLMEYVLENFNPQTFMVETGVDNIPASKLYLNLGFVETEQWDTQIGIRKVRFVKPNDHCKG